MNQEHGGGAPRTLWIITPVYFDVEAFLRLRSEILQALDTVDFPLPADVRLMAIDDSGGQDPEVALVPHMSVLPTPFNLGHQGALVFGLRRLASEMEADDWVVTLDADGEDQPADLPRLLRELSVQREARNHVVLAWRRKREESLVFKLFHFFFRLIFRALTGTYTRTGNFAAFHGHVARQILFHPYFDLSYSSALFALQLPSTLVPCDRGRRYAGRSKMGVSRLIMHGLRMLMPFADRITTRALMGFGALFGTAFLASIGVLMAWLVEWSVPIWMWLAVLWITTLSVIGLVNLVILFVVFVQFRSGSMRGLHEQTFVQSPARPVSDEARARGR